MIERTLSGLNPAGFHRIAYTEWGARDGRATVCVHGLTRNGRDFDVLAAALSDTVRVVCPDVVGRGRSDRLPDSALYGYPQYCADMAALIARLDVADVDWVGTSMGGLIGMMLAARPDSPIRRLVVNDVGPFIPKAALERIAEYVGTDPGFADLEAVELYLRRVLEPFGHLTDGQWAHLARHGAHRRGEGDYRLAYDPAIGHPFRSGPIADVDLWAVWDRIRCPVLVLRGEDSDLLLPETAEEMAERGPKARIVEIPGCGHAPSLMTEDQVAMVREFLEG